MATAIVDAGFLSASYSLPESTFQSLLSEPTIELVQSLLTQIEVKARAYDDLQSDRIRADVELENAVQVAEQRARALKTNVDTAHKETEEIRLKLIKEEQLRRQVAQQFDDFKAKSTDSSSEVQVLQSRIKTLESQNRDTIALHETKVSAYDRLAAELSEQHQKSVNLRKQLSTLEEINQSLENVASNVKFRETNLQQEIEQLRKNNDWYTTELKTRTEDYIKYRKEKNAQITQLQSENADATETIESLRRTETLLRQHVDDLKSKAEQDRLHIEQLESSAAKVESDFRIELDSARRLAALHQQNAESAKKRLFELQDEAEKLQNDAAAEIGQLQADIELERNRAAETEGRIAELETLNENLQAEISQSRVSVRPPGTPRHMKGSYATPTRAGSPVIFSPSASQGRAGLSNTQMLKENMDLKAEIRNLRQKKEEQAIMINEMLEELERHQPEFEDLRRQNDSLSTQTTELSTFLDEAIVEREEARRDARKALGDLQGIQNESGLLRNQIQDMTIQLRSLLWRREADQNGLDSLPAEQKQFILNAVDNQVPDDLLSNDSATQNTITKHLVLYKNISELQAQNAELLRTIRKVGEEHEAQEARGNAAEYKKNLDELSKMRITVAERDEQIKSLNLRSQTFKTERDMYYRIVVSRGHTQSDEQTVSAFAHSVPANGAPLQLGQQLPSGSMPQYDNLIKDLQAHINLLKEESTTDRATMRAQVDGLTKENCQLQTDKLRFESQVRREQDRYNRLESTIKLLQSEKDTLQERCNSALANSAKRDDRAVKAEQDLADVTARIQGLENELVNLKASQNISKTIEARLNDRVKELTEERDRLSRMVSEIQSLRNEQELTNAENRRRLQANHDKLETDLQIVRRKLEDEIADHRKTIDQRDYERTEAQRRIDDLVTARNNAEVKSVSAESTRLQLEQRIKDLQTQLQSAESSAHSLRHRPSPRVTLNNNEEEEEQPRSGDDELSTQVHDLRRRIQRKEEDLEAANAQMKGFQDIAQDAEDRLQAFVEAHEQLQQELDLAQQEKDATISDLQQRVDEISSELATTTTELTELRGSHEQEILQLSQRKDALEAEITRINNDVTDFKGEAEAQAELVKSQAEIATRAQKDYEYELAKHGETMKNLRILRDEHSQLQTQIVQFLAQAESARTTLEQSQEHWKSIEAQFATEQEEAKRRYNDLKQYNETLLRQFDEYKAQIDNLKNDRAATTIDKPGPVPVGSNNLHDIEVYLRREKEILEVQLNLKDQEVKRLEHQLTHAQNQLDQVREKLITEQSKAQASQSGASLQNLQDKIEQLNLFRESNSTLRSDNGRLQAQLTIKTNAWEELQRQFEPLQTRVTELEGELELTGGHLKAVEEDRDRWQKRHQDVLQRYDRIDPKELEDLKTQIENLKTEREEALAQINSLNDKTRAVEAAQQAIIQETREATIAEVTRTETEKARKGFNRIHNDKMAAKKAEIDVLTSERDSLQTQLTNAQQELEETRLQLSTAQAEASQAKEQFTLLKQQLEQSSRQLMAVQGQLSTARSANASVLADVDMTEEGQVNENSHNGNQDLERLQIELHNFQQRVEEADAQARSYAAQLSGANERIEVVKKEVVEKDDRINQLQRQIADNQSSSAQVTVQPTAVDTTTGAAMSEEIQKVRDELLTAKKQVEDLRTQLEIASSATQSDKTQPKAESQLSNEQADLLKTALDQREAELDKLEAELKTRQDSVTAREAKSQGILDRANNKILKIREDTNKEIERLKADHQTELEQLKSERQTASSTATAPATTVSSEAPSNLTVTVADDMIDTQSLPRPSVTAIQFKTWINGNPAAKNVIGAQIRRHVEAKEKDLNTQVIKLNQEIVILKAQQSTDAPAPVKTEPAESTSQDSKTQLDNARAEYEKNLKDTLEKEKQGWIQRGKDEEGKRFNVKMNMANRKTEIANDRFEAIHVKWLYVQKAATDTPMEEVAKVFEQANQQKPPPKPVTPANLPAKPAIATQPALGTQVQQQPSTAAAQTNGTAAAPIVPPVPNQIPNLFVQGAQGTAAPNSFMQTQGQMGRGLPVPGFANAVQAAQTQQQPQAQFGRGRGDGVGTGPQALRGVLQSALPRGGSSNIPQPGGRGRGQHTPGQGVSAQGGVASQIARGGGRGSIRGRGGRAVNTHGQPNVGPNSPRGGLNPGATQFQPGGGGSQKRSAEDEGGDATRGGKRPRGRGGHGGGAAAAAE